MEGRSFSSSENILKLGTLSLFSFSALSKISSLSIVDNNSSGSSAAGGASAVISTDCSSGDEVSILFSVTCSLGVSNWEFCISFSIISFVGLDSPWLG